LFLLVIIIPIKGSRYYIKILYYKLSLKKSLKRNKPSSNSKSINIKRELFTIIKTIN
jgi:hypothetical protein